MRKISGLIAVLTIGLATVSCGGGGSSGPPGGGGGGGGACPANTFCMTISNTFSPPTRSVQHGTTVTWRNDGNTDHNVTWNDAAGRSAALPGDGTGDIGNAPAGSSNSRLFNTPGTYGFHCTIHPGMNGSLTVQ